MDPFMLLIAVILHNKTVGRRAILTFEGFISNYPTPAAIKALGEGGSKGLDQVSGFLELTIQDDRQTRP